MEGLLCGVLESKEKNYSKCVVQQVCLWNDVHEKGVDNDRLIDFLKGEFDLNWLDNRAEVTKYGNDTTVKISKDSKSVIIKLNEKRNEASMTVNRDEVYKFLVCLDSKYCIGKSRPQENYLYPFLQVELNPLLQIWLLRYH
jgi:hypothetical protein